MRQLARLKENVAVWNSTRQRIEDAIELAEMGDDAIADDLAAETAQLSEAVDAVGLPRQAERQIR